MFQLSKKTKIKILNINRQEIYSFSLFLLSLTIIQFSPPLLDEIQPDSSGYMYPTQNRQTLYYLLITLLNKIGINIILFQKILLSFSISSIVIFIARKTSIFLGLVTYSLIIFNTYYISYSKTILPESILFSLLNLAIIYLFEERKNSLIIFPLICGTMASLKPVGILLSLVLFMIFLIKNKKKKKLLIFLLFFSIPNVIENSFFYSQFNKRTTVFKHSVIGKLVVLSGIDSFVINDYSDELHPFLEKTKKEYKIDHKFLNNLDSILLKAELLSDYEVIAQYQIFNFDSIKEIEFDENILFENTNKIFFEILKNNYYDYLKLSFLHYIGNWSVGYKVRFLNENQKKIPLFKELVKSSGPINLPNKILLEFAQMIFILILFILTLHTFYLFLYFSKLNVNKTSFINYSIIFLIQFYLIIICLTNVSTPRYLMVVYPLIIMSIVNFLYYFYNKETK